MDPESEKRLLEAAKNKPTAIAPLYDYYFPRVHAFVCYRVPLLTDVEDIVAEIFLQVIKELQRFEWRHNNSFAAWLFRIAHNRVADYYRRKQPQTIELDEIISHQAAVPLPEESLLRQEIFGHLHHLLSTLSPRKQEIISLKFFGRLNNQEIARILGIDERTVASHLCRGLRELHQKYYLELEVK